jgi:hypothetical protein
MKGGAMSAAAYERILADNRRDMNLYQYAVEHFDSQLTALGPSFSRRLARFERMNPWYGRLRWVYRASGLAGLRSLVRGG